MVALRYYQEEAILALYDYFARKTGNPIIALPTGTGKSLVIAEFLRSVFAYYPGQRMMMLTHVAELIEQNYQELVDVWPLAPAGIYSAGVGRREIRPITFAGIQSVYDKAAEFGHIDIVKIDECHLVSPKEETTYQNFLADLRRVNPNLKVIGLTATPYRLGQGLLTNPIETSKGPRPSIFTDICYNKTDLASFNRFIDEGYLCKLRPKPTKEELDVTKVSTKMGEFKLDELQLAVDRMEITRKAIDETEQVAQENSHSSGRPRCRWLVFATGVEHAKHITEEFAERGYKVKCVTNKTNKKDRKEAVRWFKEEVDEVRVLVNNGVFTVGFNCRQLDLIIVLRPTNSPGLWVQILGRGTRPYEGKDDCLVMDFAGNIKRCGPINDPILPRRKGQGGKGEAPVKICEKCGTYNHASVRFCTHCQAEFERAVKFREHASTEEVIKASAAPLVEVFPVHRVEYAPHRPVDKAKPPSLKVTYWSHRRAFTEYICLQHGGLVGEKARNWWRKATIHAELQGPPATVEEAVARLGTLQEPKAIRVFLNGDHPRVMDRDYTGNSFGTASNSGKPQKEAVA